MGNFSTQDLLPGKLYTVEIDSGSHHWFRIIDESGEDYLYSPEIFEVIEE